MQPLKRILYFEIDSDIRSETIFVLEEKGGFDVFAFETVESALERISELYPDLILLNAEMPEMTAPELLHKLRKHDHLAQVPAVLLTRQDISREILHNNDVGIIELLKKPMGNRDVIIRLHEIWGEFDRKRSLQLS